MDPEANQAEQLELAERILGLVDTCDSATGEHTADTLWRVLNNAERLAELVLALAEWRARGGFVS